MTATVVFPGCHNVLFTNCHHVNEWELGGSTDLDNLALMCVHHHYLIHSRDWSMRGDANVELHFVGPNGQVMTTRPSRLWAQVTDPALWPSGGRPGFVSDCRGLQGDGTKRGEGSWAAAEGRRSGSGRLGRPLTLLTRHRISMKLLSPSLRSSHSR